MGLDIVELVMEVEEQYLVDIPNDEAAQIVTVGQLFDFVAVNSPLFLGRTLRGRYTGSEWEGFLDLVERETGVRREQLTPSARFVQDLHLD